MAPPTPTLPDSFFSPVLALQDNDAKIRWYMCVVINLSSLNYADVIPQVYNHLDTNLLSSLSHEDQFTAVQKVREGLTKTIGIAGAARTGNGLRVLADCTPDELMLKDAPRKRESEETAIKRGNEFFNRVYDRNPTFDRNDTERASPDYMFIIKGKAYRKRVSPTCSPADDVDIIYGRVFSYDYFIDDMTSSYAMVSALYGMNSPGQLRNHMIGMLLNGESRDNLKTLQELLLGLADILGVTFRYDPVPIPTIPTKDAS